MQETKTLPIAKIGEHIGMELGTTMIKSFFDAFPTLAFGHTVGKEILAKMLTQPGCEGLTMFPALNETGMPTMVLASVDSNRQVIESYQIVSAEGSLETQEAMIVDRIKADPW